MRYYRSPINRGRRLSRKTLITRAFAEDATLLKQRIANLPTLWDGKASVMELREAGRNADRPDWWVAYFETLCFNALRGEFQQPGDRFGATAFHLKRNINWDVKAKAIRSDSQIVVLHDARALRETIRQNGEAGVILALCDVEYGDTDRAFEKWRTDLINDASANQNEREPPTATSRYRITKATLTQILLLRLTRNDLPQLCQTREETSNAEPRPHFKYTLNLEKISDYFVDRIVLHSP